MLRSAFNSLETYGNGIKRSQLICEMETIQALSTCHYILGKTQKVYKEINLLSHRSLKTLSKYRSNFSEAKTKVAGFIQEPFKSVL